MSWKTSLVSILNGALNREYVYYSYSKINVRIPGMPGRVVYRDWSLRQVIAMIDTSALIARELIMEFLDLVIKEVRRHYVNEFYVIQWDTEIRSVEKVKDMPVIHMQRKKTGGRYKTNVDLVVEYVSNNFTGQIDVLIMLTDGFMDFSDRSAELISKIARKTRRAVYLYLHEENKHIFSDWIRIRVDPVIDM